MSTSPLLVYLIIIVITLKPSVAVRLCQTPYGRTGDCVPLEQCTDYRNAFPEVARKAQCGFQNSKEDVCCRTNLPITQTSKNSFIESDLLPSIDVCGIQPEKRIMGGTVTDLDEHPWMARLDYVDSDGYQSSYCGGALISDRYVLTAAHCFFPIKPVNVTLGEWNSTNSKHDCIKNDCAPLPLHIPVEKAVMFNSYNVTDVHHDIALLRLQKKVEFSDFVKPICLPTTIDAIFNRYINNQVEVAGWGRTERGVPSDVKLKVKLPVVNCEVQNAGRICAGGKKGKDSCRGDSGGPLMIQQLSEDYDVNWYAIGILSYGPTECGSKNVPGVYTKVSKYMHWIVDNLEP